MAATVGNNKALEIYKTLVSKTLNALETVEADIYLYFYPEIDWEFPHQHRFPLKRRVQVGVDLGEKMAMAFQGLLPLYQKVLIIGSDCPYLTPELFNQAFSGLENHDFILGPSKDGGYYLLGMKKQNDYIFQNVTWSTNQVLTETIHKIKEADLTYCLLSTLADIDYEEDWLRYQETISGK